MLTIVSRIYINIFKFTHKFVDLEIVQVQTDDSNTEVRRYRLSSAAQTYNPVSKKKLSQTAPIELSVSTKTPCCTLETYLP